MTRLPAFVEPMRETAIAPASYYYRFEAGTS